MSGRLIDPYGREISYLRLSVTERCNLSCIYCSANPLECAKKMGKDLLTVESCLAIGQAAVELGMTKIRLTGGEPLMRADILDIISGLSAIPGLKDLSLTTNGIFLDDMASELASAGLHRVNISLDSLEEANFQRITNGGKLQSVLKGIEKSIEAGLTPVKINVVLLKGINDHEIERFIAMTADRDLCVRFIEYMPMKKEEGWRKLFLPLEKVIEVAEKFAPLVAAESDHNHGGGPARYFRLEGAKGKIGLITALSCHFCDRCNRLRVTSDGKVKPCLFSIDEVDLRPFLDSKEKLKEQFIAALELRTDPRTVSDNPFGRMEEVKGARSMRQIGG
ncbi:MAG: GTP 3',8-cyclase MoaA [Firmicutes bacterium]|nr:GTP 3',8-cyclase MoaA [Bacillota bacterium]